MLNARPTRVMLLLDQLGPLSLGLTVAGVTVLFAIGYWLLSMNVAGHGLVSAGSGRPVGFSDALYFSIATETTLGAGEIQALGLSRLLVCMQVFLGLALAGLIVAKITSMQGRELRHLAQDVAGDWIEVCELSNGRKLFTFATLSNAGTTIRYTGENFDAQGKPLGFFDAVLTDFEGSILRFRYSNSDSSTAFFSEGIVSLRFPENRPASLKAKEWVRYQGTARDFGQAGPALYEGWRATAEEIAVFRGSDSAGRTLAIQRHLARLSGASDAGS